MSRFTPQRLCGYRSLGFIYCWRCASAAMADDGDAIMTGDPDAQHELCCHCHKPLTPAPSMDSRYPEDGSAPREVIPSLAEVLR